MLGRPNEEGGNLGLHFHDYPPVSRDDLILPAATQTELERSTVEFVRHRPTSGFGVRTIRSGRFQTSGHGRRSFGTFHAAHGELQPERGARNPHGVLVQLMA